jgi:hypothetical protein
LCALLLSQNSSQALSASLLRTRSLKASSWVCREPVPYRFPYFSQAPREVGLSRQPTREAEVDAILSDFFKYVYCTGIDGNPLFHGATPRQRLLLPDQRNQTADGGATETRTILPFLKESCTSWHRSRAAGLNAGRAE